MRFGHRTLWRTLAFTAAVIGITTLSLVRLNLFTTKSSNISRQHRNTFEVDPKLWADGGPSIVTPELVFPFDHVQPRPGDRVPNILHYTALSKVGGSTDMDYATYLAIRSALIAQKPAVAYL